VRFQNRRRRPRQRPAPRRSNFRLSHQDFSSARISSPRRFFFHYPAVKCIETAGRVNDHRDQLTGRAAFLQPPKWGAILHDQLSETGSSLPPHMDGFYALRPGTPQAGLHHPVPQRLAAHQQSLLRPSAQRPRWARSPHSVAAPGSKSSAPTARLTCGWIVRPRPTMKPDISTLLKPDILILQRHFLRSSWHASNLPVKCDIQEVPTTHRRGAHS